MFCCFDIASAVINEAVIKREDWAINPEKLSDLKDACEYADQFNKSFNCTEMSVDATPQGSVIISFVTDNAAGYFVKGQRYDCFYDLMWRAKEVRIKPHNSDYFVVSYELPGVWDMKEGDSNG